ncbi:MAG: Oligopeptide transport ATP-binding protein OppD [Chlamydiales bacterium]|nr:Oligopeptide transport ATP-binding protein OppD [Chlamydiales bacterium]MCH9619700.1 Oligopeptide transport ATP-binding protein OppD [Chlamydiales bacterium]MCH9623306.1 Oligopeptide transport ATP-binding protein OppD [Chlamydiales bacterium]
MRQLEVKNLTTKLKLGKEVYKVVDNLSFDLERGKTLALVGETGCGKSMTALSLLGIVPKPPLHAIEGEILYQGINLLTLSKGELRKIRGHHIAMIFQDARSALNPVYPIGEQLLEVCFTHLNSTLNEAKKQVIRTLEEVQLANPEHVMKQFPHQLSGGMLQRVMIGMALLLSPDILIADEPTTALDVTIQKQILDLLKELQKKRGMTTLLITHDMGVVAEIADDVIVMYAGQKIEEASVYDLFDHPSHPYTQALFSSRPDRPLSQGKLSIIEGNVPRLGEYPKGCRFHKRCIYAMPLCNQEPVETFPLPQKGHKARCLLYDEHLQWKLDDESDP